MPEQEDLSIEDLKGKARAIRKNIIQVICHAGVGHAGGSLSATDLLTALYFKAMKVDPANPQWSERDRFILSKGHAASGLYCTLAERGYFPTSELFSFATIGSGFASHPTLGRVPGVEFSTGPLGQGLSGAVGIALGARLDKKDFRTWCMVGDGESQEGQVWEAALIAGHYKLDNLTVIFDYNKVQLSGTVPEVMDVAPVADKWRAFGWEVIECNGHDMGAVVEALGQAKKIKGKPGIVVAHTVKGKGVSFMEGRNEWHGKVPTEEQLCVAMLDIEAM
jgi:transketolase